MEDFKTCSKCLILKSSDNFRVRKENRRGSTCSYLNNTCRECDKIQANEYYNKLKDKESFKENNRKRTNIYSKKFPDKIKVREKVRRQTEIYKENRKKYYLANRDIILKDHRIISSNYMKRIISEIDDIYAISLLRGQVHCKGSSSKGLKFSEQQIAQKKISIAKHRLNKLIKQLENGE